MDSANGPEIHAEEKSANHDFCPSRSQALHFTRVPALSGDMMDGVHGQ
jgi:hypothetical protein